MNVTWFKNTFALTRKAFYSLCLLTVTIFYHTICSAYFEGFTAPPRSSVQIDKIATTFTDYSLRASKASSNKLTPSEIKAVRSYSDEAGVDYKMFNTYYRDRASFDKIYRETHPQPEVLEETIRDLNTGLNKLPRLSGKVYRGSQLQAQLVNELSVGDIIYEPGFLSTSILPEVALDFSDMAKNTEGLIQVLFEIELNHSGYSIAGLSQFPFEAEVLVKPKSYMRVKAIDSLGDKKLIALEDATSLGESIHAYNLYTSAKEPIGKVDIIPTQLHLICSI
ncbi:ADP-ribosyltransferase [Aeromonas veronii]|uniref:ADP-ribosyltransferase n=1 Tax=Aeromonas veronii TaxID=654 RepID=UPI0038B539BE